MRMKHAGRTERRAEMPERLTETVERCTETPERLTATLGRCTETPESATETPESSALDLPGLAGEAGRRLGAPGGSRRAPRLLQCHRRPGPAMKQDGSSRRRGDKAKAPPDGPPPAPPDVEMQEEAAATTETAGERQPQRELDAITLEGEAGGSRQRGVGWGVSVGGSWGSSGEPP